MSRVLTGGLILLWLLLPMQSARAGTRSPDSGPLVAQDSQGEGAIPRSGSSLERAKMLVRAQQWPKAEIATREYMSDNPESFEAHVLLGLVLHNEHKPKESMLEYVEADKAGDLSALDLKMFASDCAMLNNFEAADKWLTRSLEMNPKDWRGWEELGHLRFEVQHYDDAIWAFEKCLRLEPKTISAQTGIGLAYEASSRAGDAIQAYRLAIGWERARSARDYVPFLGLGRVLLSQNKAAQAMPSLREAARFAPNDPSVHQMLGKAYLAMNDLRAAQAEMEQAARLDPQSADDHFLLAQVYRKLGLYAQARTELERYSALKKNR